MAEAFLNRALAPLVFGDFDLILLLDRLGQFDEPLGGNPTGGSAAHLPPVSSNSLGISS